MTAATPNHGFYVITHLDGATAYNAGTAILCRSWDEFLEFCDVRKLDADKFTLGSPTMLDLVGSNLASDWVASVKEVA